MIIQYLETDCENVVRDSKHCRKISNSQRFVKMRHSPTRVTVNASARWQAHHAQILKEHSFVHGTSNLELFVHVERDLRLLVHGDNFMVEMPTRKEKWFSRNTMEHARRSFHSDGDTLTKTSFLNCVIRWDPASGRGELEADARHVAMVLRDPGLEKSSLVVTDACGQAPEVRRISPAGWREASERKGYHVVPVSYNACKLLSRDRPDLSFAARLPGTRDEESHDEGPRGTQTCWTVLD